MLGKLWHILSESIQQGLAKAEGKKVDIDDLKISRERVC
jgi:hypothetical protein